MHLDQETLIFFGSLVVAVILHEISHGLVALWFGDRTAKEAGRLTLNPVPHIDPFGSIVLPAMGAITGLPVLAWAKPVPVNPARMRNPRRDMLFVSLAGPATNFLLMFASALAARLLFDPATVPPLAVSDLPLDVKILFLFAVVNLFLGLFNLLPIPPLDGSSLIERVLPGHWLPNWHKFRPYGFLVLFLLVFSTGVISQFLAPFYDWLARFVFPVKVAHLSGRFVRALWPGPARADDVAWVASVLTPEGNEWFRRQPNHDQRHAIGVARDVQARLAGTEYADDPRWLSAALLHDVGKLESGLSVHGRVAATMWGAAAGREHAAEWSASRGFTRRVGLYLRHPELGADRIRLAGEPDEAARWAAAHHDPSTWADLPIPAPVVVALDEADND